MFTLESDARFSPCRSYRYLLTRRWASAPLLCWIMLNPSTADETVNDPTIERCERRAAMTGYGGIVVANLFALRSTDPRSLFTHPDPVGPDNDAALREAASSAGLIICAWGNHGPLLGRSTAFEAMLLRAGAHLHALKVGKTGQPGHPLYIGYDVKPTVWRSPAPDPAP